MVDCPHFRQFHEQEICTCPGLDIDFCCGPDFLCPVDMGPWGAWRAVVGNPWVTKEYMRMLWFLLYGWSP